MRITRAKNDQLGHGRSTFVSCKPGSDMDQLLRRWKARIAHVSTFVFPNLANGRQLTPSAVAACAKKVLVAIGRPEASHHSLRRGKANNLVSDGLTREQVQQRGRWRSSGGLTRYLMDSPAAQGFAE